MKVGMIGCYPIDKKCIKGGVESSVFGLVQALKGGCEVVVYDNPRKNGINAKEIDGDIEIYRHVNTSKWNFLSIRLVSEIVDKIKKDRVDICHIHGAGFFEYSLYKQLLKNNIPVIITIHGLVHIEKQKALKIKRSVKLYFQFLYQSYYEFKLLSKCRKIIVDTEYVKETISSYSLEGKVASLPQMYVIPQGINDMYYNIKCSPTSNNILSVGSISSRKGHLFLLQSFDRLCVNHKDVELTIIGVKASNLYYEELMNYINSSPNRDKIHLMTNIDQDCLYEEYAKAHIFALHSEEESQGIVLSEAMATGLPVVSTNVGGIPHVVENGTSGLLSQYTDVGLFAENLSSLFDDDEKWNKMSTNAIERAKFYNWHNIAEEIYKLYIGLVN